MTDWVKICGAAELPGDGEAREVHFHRREFCVARSGNDVAVMDNVCPHEEGPLGQGFVENGRVVCPYHAWAFDLKTGEAEHNPKARVQIYESKVENGALSIRLPEF